MGLRSTTPLLTGVLLAGALAACDGGSSGGTGGGGSGGSGGGDGGGGATTTATETTSTTETTGPDAPWTFEPVTVDGLQAVWGGMVAQVGPKTAYLAGGVSGTTGPVTGNLVRVEQGPSGVVATPIDAPIASRYCGCAMVDPTRQELIVLGGRGSGFEETKTAEIVDLATGTVTPLDAPDATAHPVGCHAVFLPDRDEGYVFGGAGQGAGFTAGLWRYTPADHALTAVDAPAGPEARYDGAFRYPEEGGPVWLAGGMGAAGGAPKFFADVWKLDPASGTWTEVVPSGAMPPGRRLPWVAFSGDGAALVMGFGSDSAAGSSMLGDLWHLDLGTGAWSEIPSDGDASPGSRGFAMWLPGPEGSAGLLSGGLAELGIAKDAFVIRPPVAGDWR